MYKRVSIALLVVLAVLMFTACPGTQNQYVTSTATTKTVAEDILFYARVYQNMGKISAAQFEEVRKAYEAVRSAQDTFIDARIAYLKAPADATAEQQFQRNLSIVLQAMQRLTLLAYNLGLVKDGGGGIVQPIPIR